MEEGSRTTKDIDLLNLSQQSDIYHTLLSACKLDLQDWFVFEVARPVNPLIGDFGGIRFSVRALLDSRTFEEFHLDTGVGDPIVASIDFLKTPSLLEFAGIQPTVVPCYPITQQIAEKVHALTRSHPSREGSRVKDLVDILPLAELGEIDGELLTRAIKATFDARQTHTLPINTPEFPSNWMVSFRKLADEVGLTYRYLQDANDAVKEFLNPIFSGETQGRWDPIQWTWNYG